MPYDYKPYDYVPPPGLTGPEPRHRVAIVGAGPIGLAMAVELANHGIEAVVLDDNNVVSIGSRAICWSKRSLEILDRLGVGAPCVEKGVIWKVGRTFHREAEVFNFDLLPEDGHKMPAFVNLQQYWVEEYLVDRAQGLGIDLRWKNRVADVVQHEDHAVLSVETPDGSYELEADWVIACDGSRSPVRGMLGLDFEGELFEERFLIADIEMEADFPRNACSGSSRPSTTDSRRCCTSSRTISTGSTCSWGGTPTRRWKRDPNGSFRAFSGWWGTAISPWTGRRSTPSSAGG